MTDDASAGQWARNKKALDDALAELVRSVAEVGEARIAAREHMRDSDNFLHASHHRKVTEQGKQTYDKAVEAFVRLRSGPQPAPAPDVT